MRKIIITGGHVTPALSVMSELKLRNWECIYVGRTHALEGDKTQSEEMRIVVKEGYKFIPITTGRLQRQITRYTLISLLKIPIGIIQAFIILLQNKPQVILSFGGYVGLPIVLAGWCLGIPIVTHEQTLSPGLANRLSARFAKVICVSWPALSKKFPKKRFVYTGLPVRKEIFQINKQINIQSNKPVIYITGGNLGSHSINEVVEKNLPQLLKTYTIIHQCGKAMNEFDYKRLINLKNQLPKDLKDNYYVYTYIDKEFIGDVFRRCDILISRAGANIIYEIIALHKLAILIPLPWSGMKEQEINAKFLTDHQAGVTIEQKNLSGEILLKQIPFLMENRDRYLTNLDKLKNYVVSDADKRIAQVIESVE